MAGSLVLVATPIGNLGDLSPRAVEALREADVIACEDTRHSRKLLSHAGITGSRLIAVHDHNEAEQAGAVLGLLERGKRVAMITDAGTPGISDPGERVVAAVAAEGYRVEIVPGPSAVVAALAVSGLPTRRFCFEGFLPRKGPERKARLEAVARSSVTTVIYESPHRAARTARDVAEACGGDREVAVTRELTKLHEEVWRGSASAAAERLASEPARGELVLVVGPAAPAGPVDDAAIEDALRERTAAGDSSRAAVVAVAGALGVPKRRVYELALRLSSGEG